MAHFAKLDNNVVTQVITVNNSELFFGQEIDTLSGQVIVRNVESEAKGIAFCQSLYGKDTIWKQTSYNGNFRGKYAGIGDIYDAVTDEFRDSNVEAPVETPQTETPVVLTSFDIPALTSEQISGLE